MVISRIKKERRCLWWSNLPKTSMGKRSSTESSQSLVKKLSQGKLNYGGSVCVCIELVHKWLPWKLQKHWIPFTQFIYDFIYKHIGILCIQRNYTQKAHIRHTLKEPIHGITNHK
jgi:hypothetical protein